MHQYQERYGEEDRKQGGMTRVKDIWKVWVKGGGQSGRMIFITIPAIPDDGKSLRRRRMQTFSLILSLISSMSLLKA